MGVLLKTLAVKSGVPIRLCKQNKVLKATAVFGLL